MKKISLFLAVITLSLILFSCGKFGAAKEPETVGEITEITAAERESKMKLALTDNFTSLSLLKLVTDRGYAYEYEKSTDCNDIYNKLVNGEYHIASLPLSIAKKGQKSGKIQIKAIDSLGAFYIVTDDTSIKSFADLKGKKVFAEKELYLNDEITTLLKSSGLSKDDVEFEYISAEELETSAIENKASICLMSEPHASMVVTVNEKLKKVINLQSALSEITDKEYAYNCIAVNTAYAESNPDKIDEFLMQAKISANFIKNGLSGTLLVMNTGYAESTQLANRIISGSNIVFITGDDLNKLL